MVDNLMKNGFDHPCRGTCSGWQQGYERGQYEAKPNWHPIDLANKNGDLYLLHNVHDETYQIGRFKKDVACWVTSNGDVVNPTHFIDIPKYDPFIK